MNLLHFWRKGQNLTWPVFMLLLNGQVWRRLRYGIPKWPRWSSLIARPKTRFPIAAQLYSSIKTSEMPTTTVVG
jgi:hypothetical protein